MFSKMFLNNFSSTKWCYIQFLASKAPPVDPSIKNIGFQTLSAIEQKKFAKANVHTTSWIRRQVPQSNNKVKSEHEENFFNATLRSPSTIIQAFVLGLKRSRAVLSHPTPRPAAWHTLLSSAEGAMMSSPTGRTTFVGETLLPTTHGTFRIRSYRHTLDGLTFTDPIAIICGRPEDAQSLVPVRVHDACWTSEVLGSLKCDCARQLQQALDYIRDAGCGIVLYLHQEGRGIGLANKIAAYGVQEKGLDTVAANRALGLPDDSREYTAVKDILDDLHLSRIELMTNNPRKVRELQTLGITVERRMSCVVADPGQLASQYLSAKVEQMGHILTDEVDILSAINEAPASHFGVNGAHGDNGF